MIEYYYSTDGSTVPNFDMLDASLVQSAMIASASGFLNGAGISFSPIVSGSANLSLNYAGQYIWARIKTQSNNMVSSVWSAPVCIGQLPKIKLNAPSVQEGIYENDCEKITITPQIKVNGVWKPTQDTPTVIERVAMHKSLTIGMVTGAKTYEFSDGKNTLIVTVEGTKVTYSFGNVRQEVLPESGILKWDLFYTEVEANYKRTAGAEEYLTEYVIESYAKLIINYVYDENGVVIGVESLTLVLPDIESFPYFVVDANTHEEVTAMLTASMTIKVSGDESGAEDNTIVWTNSGE